MILIRNPNPKTNPNQITPFKKIKPPQGTTYTSTTLDPKFPYEVYDLDF
jgi:hypothetical protein